MNDNKVRAAIQATIVPYHGISRRYIQRLTKTKANAIISVELSVTSRLFFRKSEKKPAQKVETADNDLNTICKNLLVKED